MTNELGFFHGADRSWISVGGVVVLLLVLASASLATATIACEALGACDAAGTGTEALHPTGRLALMFFPNSLLNILIATDVPLWLQTSAALLCSGVLIAAIVKRHRLWRRSVLYAVLSVVAFLIVSVVTAFACLYFVFSTGVG